MNGIKMSNCKFYVNEEERTIVCVIPYTRGMLSAFIYENFRWPDLDLEYGINSQLDDQLKMPSSFMGKAVCAPEDEWNEELGKKIAASRCNEKIAKKRLDRSVKKLAEAKEDVVKAENHKRDMESYHNDAYIAYNIAAMEHDLLIASLHDKN